MRWRLALWLCLGFASVPALIHHSGLVLNYSASVPLGLYRIAPAGGYAGFCLTDAQARTALHEGMDAIRGDCPEHLAPLLKPITEATPEKPLTLTPRGIVRDGLLLTNTAPKERSKKGIPLGHYPFGTYSDGLWAVNGYSPDSYDSRYFGPIAPSAIRFRAEPILTW